MGRCRETGSEKRGQEKRGQDSFPPPGRVGNGDRTHLHQHARRCSAGRDQAISPRQSRRIAAPWQDTRNLFSRDQSARAVTPRRRRAARRGPGDRGRGRGRRRSGRDRASPRAPGARSAGRAREAGGRTGVRDSLRSRIGGKRGQHAFRSVGACPTRIGWQRRAAARVWRKLAAQIRTPSASRHPSAPCWQCGGTRWSPAR